MIIKLAVSVGVALLASIAALAAGMMTDARMETAALRAVKCFFISGIVVFIATILFEKVNILKFIFKRNDDDEAAADDDAVAANNGTIAEKAADKAAEGADKKEAVPEPAETEDNGFVPLGADNLRRVSTQ